MGIEVRIVRCRRALDPPALAPVDRELPLAALVDEARGQGADGRRIACAVGLDQLRLVAISASAGRAHHVAREEAAERSAVEAARSCEQRTESETAEEQQADELDGRLA